MDKFLVWNIASMAWTEIGLEPSEYPDLAKELKKSNFSWKEIDEIIFRDVCWSFSLESASMIFIIIPLIGLFFITPLPDWGYDETYLRERMDLWSKKSIASKFLNPFRIIGYPIALLFVLSVRNKLKKAYHDA